MVRRGEYGQTTDWFWIDVVRVDLTDSGVLVRMGTARAFYSTLLYGRKQEYIDSRREYEERLCGLVTRLLCSPASPRPRAGGWLYTAEGVRCRRCSRERVPHLAFVCMRGEKTGHDAVCGDRVRPLVSKHGARSSPWAASARSQSQREIHARPFPHSAPGAGRRAPPPALLAAPFAAGAVLTSASDPSRI